MRPEGSDHCRHGALHDRPHYANNEKSARAAVQMANGLPELIHACEDANALIMEQASRLRQSHRTAGTIEQNGAKFLLELPYLAAERWLRHADSFGGAREIPLTRHSDEIAEMPQFHNTSQV
jgi:hypothetical protein